jgi:hypothetical protein
MDAADDRHGDAGEAALWLEDYWRVLGESEQAEASGATMDQDRILPGPEAEDDAADVDDEPPAADDLPLLDEAELAAERTRAGALSLPLRYLEMARSAQDAGSWTARILSAESLPIRLAVYHKLLGVADDSYPDAWLDPATGELPTLQQLAALDQISMPTLRKRRNEAIDKLYAGERT